MTRTIMRSAVLLGLGLTLTACAQHNPAQANCFNFRDAPAQAATATTTISTMGADSHAARHGLRFRDAGGGRLSRCGAGFPASMVSLALAGPTAGPAVAQGVPTFDLRLFAERQAILEQTDRDLALQQDRLTREEELAEIERQQLASLEGLMDAMSLGSGDVAGTVAGLEAGQGAVDEVESAAASLYAPEDNNPAAARMFGDAREGIEELIIRAARDTHGLPGVSRAGLSLVQWRCLLQALIWQESRFQIGARSPAGSFRAHADHARHGERSRHQPGLL